MARVRIPKVIALGWVLAAVGITVALGPELGLRGWMWLGAHHLLCAIGAGWELLVRRDDRASAPSPRESR